MSATLVAATNEMLSLFKAVWDPTGHPVLYPNIGGQPPTTPVPWARISIIYTTDGQRSLSNEAGVARYGRTGIIIVQVFVGIGSGLNEAQALAKIIMDAYEGVSTASGVWFRDVFSTPIGESGQWHQLNVSITFTYDEVK